MLVKISGTFLVRRYNEKYTELEKILKKLKAPETEFFAKVYDKCKICQKFWKQRLQTWILRMSKSSEFDFQR